MRNPISSCFSVPRYNDIHLWKVVSITHTINYQYFWSSHCRTISKIKKYKIYATCNTSVIRLHSRVQRMILSIPSIPSIPFDSINSPSIPSIRFDSINLSAQCSSAVFKLHGPYSIKSMKLKQIFLPYVKKLFIFINLYILWCSTATQRRVLYYFVSYICITFPRFCFISYIIIYIYHIYLLYI